MQRHMSQSRHAETHDILETCSDTCHNRDMQRHMSQSRHAETHVTIETCGDTCHTETCGEAATHVILRHAAIPVSTCHNDTCGDTSYGDICSTITFFCM